MADKLTGDSIKVWLDVLKTVGFIVVFMILVVHPKILKTWCNAGGFSECNFFGNKLTIEQQQAIQLTAQTAAETVSDSKAQIMGVQDDLAALKQVVKNAAPRLDAQTKITLEERLKKADDKVASVVSNTAVRSAQNLKALNSVIDQVAPTGNWAIVFGGDPKHVEAIDELKRAEKAGHTTVQLYHRRNAFRSVITYPNRDAAHGAMPVIVSLSARKDAYMVNLDTWCPKPEPGKDSYGTYIECGG